MVCFFLQAAEGIRYISGRSQIGDIIHQEIHQSVHKLHITDFVFLSNIPNNQRVKYIRNIIKLCFLIFIEVGPGHATFYHIFVKCGISVTATKKLHIFAERERKYLDFKGSSGKQRCQIWTQEEGIWAGNINVKFFRCVQTIDRFLKPGTHLYLVNQDEVILPTHILGIDVII